jgi:hypothetical protein
MRYGLLQDSSGLHNIWKMGNPTTMAATQPARRRWVRSLLIAVSIRVFTRKAVS